MCARIVVNILTRFVLLRRPISLSGVKAVFQIGLPEQYRSFMLHQTAERLLPREVDVAVAVAVLALLAAGTINTLISGKTHF